MFGSDTMMKFNIIKNELHNIMRSQLKRVDGEVSAMAQRIKALDENLALSEQYIKTATATLAEAVQVLTGSFTCSGHSLNSESLRETESIFVFLVLSMKQKLNFNPICLQHETIAQFFSSPRKVFLFLLHSNYFCDEEINLFYVMY